VHRADGSVVAIKDIDKRKLSIRDLQLIHEEINICRSLSHPGILKLLDSFTDKATIHIVTELIEGQELFFVTRDATDHRLGEG
jgi:serine/threonine protein kinase